MRGEAETIDLEALLGTSRRTLVAAAHELKAPLSLIRLYAARLEDTSLTEAQRKQYNTRLLFTAEQMLQLTSDLLEGYRWEQGQLPLEPVNTNIICEEVLHELTPAAHELSQRLILKDAGRANIAVGHAQFLKNVVWGIVFNALKHTPAGTEVTIGAKRQGERAYISVTDTGPGFQRQTVKYIDEQAGERLQMSLSRAQGGLGLAVAKQLITAMNGALHLKASPKGGYCLVSLYASRQMPLPL